MALNQLSVFVDNTPGALSDIAEVLANADINLRALSIADTERFGILPVNVFSHEDDSVIRCGHFTADGEGGGRESLRRPAGDVLGDFADGTPPGRTPARLRPRPRRRGKSPPRPPGLARPLILPNIGKIA